MKLYLLEAFHPNMQFDDGVIVALTPEVCYHLDKNGINYSIIEDHYDEHELLINRYEFLEDQNDWFIDFDNFLKYNINILNIYELNLASIYSLHLKNILDTLILKSYILKKLFEKFNPSSVIFVALPPKKELINNDLGYHDKSVYAHLIPILCKEKSIPIVEHYGYSAQNTKIVAANNIDKVANIWRYIPIIFKMVFSIFKTKNKKNALNVLQMSLAYNGFALLKNAFIRGHNVYLLAGNKILKFHHFGFKTFDIKHSNDNIENMLSDWSQTAQLLETHELIKWINEKCSFDVSNIVLPNLKHFVSKICPDLFQYYKTFLAFYESESIDVVVSPYNNQSTVGLAGIAAANKCEHTKTICVEHGDDIFINFFWRRKELINFDILIVSENENKRFLESICYKYNFGIKIYSNLERMSPNIEIAKNRKTRRFNSNGNKTEIIYLPTFFNWDLLRIDVDIHLSPTRYYKFQKLLLEYFSERKDFTFIWKALFSSDSLYNPIPDLIKDKNIKNVRVESKSFNKYLRYAYKVILDYPSTGMYESVIAGVPTMCLCSDALHVRKSAIEVFKNIVKIYLNPDEAIAHIDEFINADSEQYKMSIKTCDPNLIDIIEFECRN
ncbi:MAG: hypothetical protein C3F06_07820 [Candidatus Methanoperedenaceae archaeon]|nr:MAG: hypothetical protein C3F06_07820 [Candidatus Methanoperedenaceae archaeon]